MDKLLKNAFKLQIQSKEGFDFEDFIDELFMLKYGDGYSPIRRNKDKGNDGTIISEQKIVACYAPRKYSEKDFISKVNGNTQSEGDYPKYEKNWKAQYPYWQMMVNHEIAPEQFTLIRKLGDNASIKGIDQIMFTIEHELNVTQQRKLAAYLDISDYFKQDYIASILQDLLNNTGIKTENVKYKQALYIPKKIELNYSFEDVDGAISEFHFVIKDFSTVENILSGYEDEEKNTIKWRVIDDFTKLSGDFKNKLITLQTQYCNQYGNIDDDDYRRYVKVILLYMFEQCLIGKKTESEL